MSSQYGTSIVTETDGYALYNKNGPIAINTEQIAINNSFGNNRHRDALIDTNNIITLNFNDYERNFIEYTDIEQGTNEYLFTQAGQVDRWIGIFFDLFLNEVAIGAFKIMFSNSQKLSLQDAVTQGYIYPLVPISTWTWYNYWMNGIMQGGNICNIIDGEFITDPLLHRVTLIMFKVRSADALPIGVEFYSSRKIVAGYNNTVGEASGLRMFIEPEDYDLSIMPFNFDFWNVEISQSLEDYRNKQFVKGGWDYYYGDAVVNYMENVDGIVARQMTEGGSGVYGAIYEDNSEDTNVREITAETGTTTTNIKITNHGLKYGDMIMNLSKRSKARVSAVIDVNNVLIDPAISAQAEGNIIATYPDANAICRNNLNKYGLIIPKDISFETTALDFVPGTKLTVNLQAFGMTANEYYLIESVELRDEDGINLLASVTATQRDATEFNTQQSESWVDTFAKLGGSNSGSQIIEMTSDRAGGLAYFTPGKYIVKKDDTLPVIAELDGAATLTDVIAKVNALLQTLVSRQHLGDGTPATGLKRVDIYKYS